MAERADLIIVGSGPIATSTAYWLFQGEHPQRVVLLTEEPTDRQTPTYRFAGGSVRWTWDDPQMVTQTSVTADFLRRLIAQGVDLGALDDHYLLLHRGGQVVPSLNINSGKLVDYFLNQARRKGLVVIEKARVTAVTEAQDGYRLATSQGVWKARRVVLAVGAALPQLVPQCPIQFRKRELLVLDLPVTAEQRHWPHTVAPLGKGLVYLFLKQFANGLKFCLGQENLLEFSMKPQAEDFLPALQECGLEKVFPFLQNARVSEILWGFDDRSKKPTIIERNGLMAVTCGSAVRSCVGIGRKVAELLRIH